MNEDSKESQELKGKDLDSYIEAKGITRTCPSCGGDNIMIVSHGPEEPLHIMVMEMIHPESQDGKVVELVAFLCDNCGNVRTFAKKWILQWIEEESPSVE